MAYIICIIGLFNTVMGCSVIMQPALLSKSLQFCKKQPFFYLSSGIKAAIGILFLIWATSLPSPVDYYPDRDTGHHWQPYDVLYPQSADSKTH